MMLMLMTTTGLYVITRTTEGENTKAREIRVLMAVTNVKRTITALHSTRSKLSSTDTSQRKAVHIILSFEFRIGLERQNE